MLIFKLGFAGKSYTDTKVESTNIKHEYSDQFLIARTKAGKTVAIKLDLNRPQSFESETARAKYDWLEANKLMNLKEDLERGSILPEQVKDSLVVDVHVSDEKKLLPKDETITYSQKLSRLV